MAITFRQLEIFVTAATDCNFRRTADRLAIAQPSVSNHVRALENHLGHDLFVRRRGRAPVLSLEGRRFLEKAQELVISRAAIVRPGDVLAGARAMQLTIMAGPLLLDICIRPRLAEFCAQHPRFALQFVALHPSRSAAHLIDSGDIDMAIFTGEPTAEASGQPEMLDSTGCSIYASPTLAKRAGQPGTTLGELPWVMPPEGFAPARFLWRYLQQVGIRPRSVVGRSQFPDVVAHMALEGRGLTIMFDDFAAASVAEGRLLRIGPELPKISRILMMGRRARHPACRPVVDLLRNSSPARTDLSAGRMARPTATRL